MDNIDWEQDIRADGWDEKILVIVCQLVMITIVVNEMATWSNAELISAAYHTVQWIIGTIIICNADSLKNPHGKPDSENTP